MKLSSKHTLWAVVLHPAVQQTHSQVPKQRKQRIGGARYAADDNAVPSGGFMKRIKRFHPDIARSKRKPVPETGILTRKKGTPSRRLAATCSEFVECVGGRVNITTTCKTACDGRCCVGDSSCDGFTGTVCKDNVSCFGDYACFYANIGMISQSCNGTRSCFGAGFGGSIGEVYNSCLGFRACTFAGNNGGSIGEVYNSCLGKRSCIGAGSNGGYIEEVYNSCLGYRACFRAGRFGGSIGEVYNSCLGFRACEDAAYNEGNIGNISSSCNGTRACYYAAAYGGSIGDISDSCLQDYACERAAACDRSATQCLSNITEILLSCDGELSCSYAAYDNGYIGGIQNACRAEKACLRVGVNSSISSGIEDCCNEVSACENATTLPAICEITAPTSTPSSTPTTEPSPTLSSKTNKSKTNKSKTIKSKTTKKRTSVVVSYMAASMSFSTQFDLEDDDSMSLNVEKIVADGRQPF